MMEMSQEQENLNITPETGGMTLGIEKRAKSKKVSKGITAQAILVCVVADLVDRGKPGTHLGPSPASSTLQKNC